MFLHPHYWNQKWKHVTPETVSLPLFQPSHHSWTFCSLKLTALGITDQRNPTDLTFCGWLILLSTLVQQVVAWITIAFKIFFFLFLLLHVCICILPKLPVGRWRRPMVPLSASGEMPYCSPQQLYHSIFPGQWVFLFVISFPSPWTIQTWSCPCAQNTNFFFHINLYGRC